MLIPGSFGERLKTRIKDCNFSQKNICEMWGISDESLSRYFKGNTFPKADLLLKMSNSLSVSIDWLITGKEFGSEMSDEELKLIEYYRKCSEQNKSILQNTAAALSGSEPVQPAGSSNLKIG